MLRFNTGRRGAHESAPRRHRQHRASLRQLDRHALECAGWRTTLEFRENHVRAQDGRLLGIETVWVAEAERRAGRRGVDAEALDVVSATARSESRAWAVLLRSVQELGRQRSRGQVEAR
jgi:hypothetical protein